MTTDNLVDLSKDPSSIHELAAYKTLSESELNERITKVREELGDSLLILGHHYQQDDVIQHADLRGDSYQLSQMAAESKTLSLIHI